jgi:hypothetical protein
MAINLVHCAVSGTTVTRVVDLEGHVTQLICPECDASTKTCRIKGASLGGGPLAQLLDRVAADTLGSRGIRCDLC